jgi:hypothetical protein
VIYNKWMIKKTIFIIDFDGTIVGDVKYQSYLCMLSESGKHKPEQKRNDICMADIKTDFENSYKKENLLVRPYFSGFLKALSEYNKESYVFVYTASEKKWAEKQIKLIEKSLSNVFDRPILTRDDCVVTNSGKICKSISHIFPKIKRKIGIKNESELLEKHELVIIDNNDVFLDYSDRFLKCPSYNFMIFFDLWKYILPKSEINLSPIIKKGDVCPHRENGCNMKEMFKRTKWLQNKYLEIVKHNKAYSNDTFWKNATMLFAFSSISNKNLKMVIEKLSALEKTQQLAFSSSSDF